MIGSLTQHILTLPPLVVLLVVFVVPALESSAFVGFVFPGEVALILGGVVASQGRLPVAAVMVAAVAGAILGDSVGYVVGKRWGRGILDGSVGRFVKARHLDRAEDYLARRGGKAVFFGRFTATLRVLIPGLAGMSGLRYRTFLTFNVASALGWGVMSVMFGYLGGSNYRQVEHTASRIGLVALAIVAGAVTGGFVLRRAKKPSFLTREVFTFLAVGGVGYVVDVGVFNVLRASHPFAGLDPSIARTFAVAVAMCVTYVGNRTLTWRHQGSGDRRREVGLFVVFNVIGYAFSLLALVISHDLRGLTSAWADNISANVIGLGLGTVFRYLTYRRFVFAPATVRPPPSDPLATELDLARAEAPVHEVSTRG